MFGKCLRSLQRMAAKGKAPPSIRIGKTVWFYKPSVISWLLMQQQQPKPRSPRLYKRGNTK